MELEHRKWMYNRNYPNRGGLREEFVQGVNGFIAHAMSLPLFERERMVRCPCEAKNGGKLPFGKLFKETHTKKRKPGESEAEPVWGEPWAGTTHEAYSRRMEEYIQTKGCNEQGEPYKPTDEEELGIWLEVCGGVHKGRAYGLSSERSFHRLDSGLRGIGTSSDAEALDRGTLESMQRKIAMLNKELQEAAAAREADRVAREKERVRLENDMTSLKSQMNHFVRNALPHSDKSDED